MIAVERRKTSRATDVVVSASCEKDAELVRLADALNEDQEERALVPSEDPEFPGLRTTTFRNRRIAFMGDSTLLYLSKHLKAMLWLEDDFVEQNKTIDWDIMTLGQTENFINYGSKKAMGKNYLNVKTNPHLPYLRDGTKVHWTGIAGVRMGKGESEAKLDRMFDEAEDLDPDVVVVNMGFHWLHRTCAES